MLAVLTGPVRSGKSRMALELARASGRPVVLAVGGRPDDEEMDRRIRRHRAERDATIDVAEADADLAWLAHVPPDACLVVDCLGTLIGTGLADLVPPGAETAGADAEAAAARQIDALVGALLDRGGDTIVVTNEVGWGVVPATPMGRLFRDAVGRANRELVSRADAAWLVVAGRCVDLTALDEEATWPDR